MESDKRNSFSKWEWLIRSSNMMRIWLIMWDGPKPQTLGLDSELDLSKCSGSKSQPVQGQDWTVKAEYKRGLPEFQPRDLGLASLFWKWHLLKLMVAESPKAWGWSLFLLLVCLPWTKLNTWIWRTVQEIPQEKKTFSKNQKYAGSTASLTGMGSFIMNPIQNPNMQGEMDMGRDSSKWSSS